MSDPKARGDERAYCLAKGPRFALNIERIERYKHISESGTQSFQSDNNNAGAS